MRSVSLTCRSSWFIYARMWGPRGLLAIALPVLFAPQPTSLWVRPQCQESILPRLPVSTPPTGLDEGFFFISLVVGLLYSLIFCQFWLFFVFKFLLSFWLCEEAQCVYLCLHLEFPLWVFYSFIKNYLPMYMWLYMWALNSVPLLCMSVFQ